MIDDGPVRRFGVVLLSGGLDSTTVAALAQRQGYTLTALTIRYGQVHERELVAAERVARALGIEQRLIDVSFFKELAWYSALTQPDQFGLPADRLAEHMASDIPLTYVPLRNMFLLTLGAALLESQALHAIEVDGASPASLSATIFIAANAIDYSGYPDCRPEFYEAAVRTLTLGSKLGTQYGVPLSIETPLIALGKGEIVALAYANGAPLEHTWSCYRGGESPCGRCDSCLLRAKGFAEASLPDPALAPRSA